MTISGDNLLVANMKIEILDLNVFSRFGVEDE